MASTQPAGAAYSEVDADGGERTACIAWAWASMTMAWAMGTAFCRWSTGFGRALAAGTVPMAGAADGAPFPTVGIIASPDNATATAIVPTRRVS